MTIDLLKINTCCLTTVNDEVSWAACEYGASRLLGAILKVEKQLKKNEFLYIQSKKLI